MEKSHKPVTNHHWTWIKCSNNSLLKNQQNYIPINPYMDIIRYSTTGFYIKIIRLLKFPQKRCRDKGEKAISHCIYWNYLDFLKFLDSCVNLKGEFHKLNC